MRGLAAPFFFVLRRWSKMSMPTSAMAATAEGLT
jgi:hypothetical protein